MKKKGIKYFILLSLLSTFLVGTLLLVSCRKKSPSGPEEDVIINENTRIPEQNADLQDVEIKGDTLALIYKHGSSLPTFNTGDIVVGEMSGGYLKKVLSSTTKGDTINLSTEQAALTDAIEKGSIDTTFSLSLQSQGMSSIKIDTSLIARNGKKYSYHMRSGKPRLSTKGEIFEIRIPNVSIEIRDPSNELAVSVSIDTIVLKKSIDIDLNLEIEHWEINNFRLVGSSIDDVDFKGVTMNLIKSISDDAEIKLATLNLGSITIFIGPVPVVFAFELGLYAGADVSLTLNITNEIASNVNISSTNTVGAEYADDSWQSIWDNTLDGDADWGYNPAGSISATVKDFLKGSLDAKVYGVLGPSLYLKPYLYDEISYPPFDFEIGGGIGAGLAFKVEILSWKLVEFNYTFADYTKSFYNTTNAPPNIPSIPSGPSSGNINTPYDFSSSTTDPEGDNIAIRFDWGDGNISNWSSYVPSGQTVAMSHSWSTTGTYYVKAQAKDINGATSNWSSGHQIVISGGGGGWTMTYGGSSTEWGYSVQQTTDGGYIIAGRTDSYGAGSKDVYLIKTDGSGNQEWYKTYGSSGVDMGYSVRQITDGGYIIVGYTSSYGAGGWDVYLIKTDGSGNQEWYKTYGGSGDDKGYSVQQTSDGGYIIVGYTRAGPNEDVYLIKTDGNGNQEWYKTYGGSSTDEGWSVQQTTDGGYIIAGVTFSYGAVGWDVYLIKTDGSGNQEWYKTYGGSGNDYGWSVQQTTDGGYIIAGYTGSFGAGDDVYLIKTDGSGNQEWYKTYGGSGVDMGYSVQQTSDGGYIIAGYTGSYGAGSKDVYLIKTDGSGNQEWYKTYGGSNEDKGYSVQQTTDGGYIIAGYTGSYGAGSDDVYLIKIEP